MRILNNEKVTILCVGCYSTMWMRLKGDVQELR